MDSPEAVRDAVWEALHNYGMDNAALVNVDLVDTTKPSVSTSSTP